MKQREDTIRKWFSLWLDSREAELSDLFTEDAVYIESWGPEYYGREMIARWFRDWHRSGQVLPPYEVHLPPQRTLCRLRI